MSIIRWSNLVKCRVDVMYPELLGGAEINKKRKYHFKNVVNNMAHKKLLNPICIYCNKHGDYTLPI